MKSYQYKNRKGIKRIAWGSFHQLCKELAEKVSKENIDIVLGITRGGLYPATLIAGMLRKEFYPLRITRRRNDIVAYDRPLWKVDVTEEVKDKNVLIVDDIADNGETLRLVACRAQEKGAKTVKTLALITHSWAKPKPDYVSFKSDELIIFPWDTQIFIQGRWQLHPELKEAVNLQK